MLNARNAFVIAGSSGMGQAQSQSGVADCGDCRTQEQALQYGRPSGGGLKPQEEIRRPGEAGSYDGLQPGLQQGPSAGTGYNGRTPIQGRLPTTIPGQTGGVSYESGFPGAQEQGIDGRFSQGPGAAGTGRYPGAQSADGRFPSTQSGTVGGYPGAQFTGTQPGVPQGGRYPGGQFTGQSGGEGADGRFPPTQTGGTSGQTSVVPQSSVTSSGGYPGAPLTGGIPGQGSIGGIPQGSVITGTGRYPTGQLAGQRPDGRLPSTQSGGSVLQAPGTTAVGGFPGQQVGQGAGGRFPSAPSTAFTPISGGPYGGQQSGADGYPGAGTQQFATNGQPAGRPGFYEARQPDAAFPGAGSPGFYGQTQGQPLQPSGGQLNGRTPIQQGQPQQQFVGNRLPTSQQGKQSGQFTGQFAGNYVPNNGQTGRFSGTFAGQYDGQSGTTGQYAGQPIAVGQDGSLSGARGQYGGQETSRPQGGGAAGFSNGQAPGSTQQGRFPGMQTVSAFQVSFKLQIVHNLL